MFTFLSYAVVLVVGFVAGLLVGRRNPKIADAAASASNKVVADATVAADRLKNG